MTPVMLTVPGDHDTLSSFPPASRFVVSCPPDPGAMAGTSPPFLYDATLRL
jgi:hypothetical protein